MAIELKNGTDKKFIDVSSEEYRVYTFGDKETRIENPQWLNVGGNGHRLLDGEGVSHYIPFGWQHLRWKARDGAPHFVA